MSKKLDKLKAKKMEINTEAKPEKAKTIDDVVQEQERSSAREQAKAEEPKETKKRSKIVPKKEAKKAEEEFYNLAKQVSQLQEELVTIKKSNLNEKRDNSKKNLSSLIN